LKFCQDQCSPKIKSRPYGAREKIFFKKNGKNAVWIYLFEKT
jgi:hypothetical protein